MKVYTEIVIDMKSGKVIKEESFEYDGKIAECKGGANRATQAAYNSALRSVWGISDIFNQFAPQYSFTQEDVNAPLKSYEQFYPKLSPEQYTNIRDAILNQRTNRDVGYEDFLNKITQSNAQSMVSRGRGLSGSEIRGLTEGYVSPNLQYGIQRDLASIKALSDINENIAARNLSREQMNLQAETAMRTRNLTREEGIYSRNLQRELAQAQSGENWKQILANIFTGIQTSQAPMYQKGYQSEGGWLGSAISSLGSILGGFAGTEAGASLLTGMLLV